MGKEKTAEKQEGPKEGQLLFSLKETANALGRKVSSVRLLIWSGALPVVQERPRAKIYVQRSTIENFIKENTKTLKPPPCMLSSDNKSAKGAQ